MRYCVHLLPAPILLLCTQYNQSLLIYLERVYQIERNKFKFNGEENDIAEQPSIQRNVRHEARRGTGYPRTLSANRADDFLKRIRF